MKLWKKSMVWALCLAMSVAAASCFGTESESSGSDVSESVASSTESVTSESTPETPDEGGDEGGYVVASGTPEEVAAVDGSYTGQYLKRYL